MRTEREIHLSCAASVQRDIDKHMDRVKELVREALYFQACIRDGGLTVDELIASLEARTWWEERCGA